MSAFPKGSKGDGRAVPLPGVEHAKRRRFTRLTVETDGRWFYVSNDRHHGPGFTLSVKTDASWMTLRLDEEPAEEKAGGGQRPATA